MRFTVSMLGLLLAVGAASAQTPATESSSSSSSTAPQHLSRIDRLGILLDLTDGQKAQVQQVLQQQREQMQAFWQQQKASGAKPNFQQMRTERQQLRQQTLTQLQSVLSAEQLQKFQVLTSMGGFRGHRHWHHGPPPGSSSSSSSSAG